MTRKLNWKNAGYHPEWFKAAKIVKIIFSGVTLTLIPFIILFFSELLLHIFLIVIIVFLVWINVELLINNISKRWIPISLTNTIMEKLRIHIGGKLDLNGVVFFPKNKEGKYPVVITLHGYNSGRGQLNYINLALVQMGIAVISLDLRGHGESGGDRNDILYIIRDLNHILSYITQDTRLDCSQIAVIGLSLGAIIALYEGYLDLRIKHVIGLATTSEYHQMISENIPPLSRKWWWKLSQRIGGLEVEPTSLQSRLVSPALIANHTKSFFDVPVPWDIDNEKRVLLIQCLDDYIVEPDNFEKNKKAFNLK
ncbi:MAG: alpha/beta fold hydrolase, partial [Candidatus Lokiarchaeota archaeon]|nr:alpha/beta fold hydrolase [Candidatus Lokiarchaeota archaeon]